MNYYVDFFNAPHLIYNKIISRIEELGILEIYVIRDVFGKNGMYLVTKEKSLLTVEMLMNKFFSDNLEPTEVNVSDFIDPEEIVIEPEKEVSSYGEFIRGLYSDNINNRRTPPWLLDRHLQFASWFDNQIPEKIISKAKVITGYSYKGGMGRSTLIAILATQAALDGKNVVVLDFDFEAPGISNLLVDFGKQKYSKGILDYIIDKPIIGDKIKIENYYIKVPNNVTSPVSDRKLFIPGDIRVFPASDMSEKRVDNYMQKISRVNFAAFSKLKDNPLLELLKDIDDKLQPDVIFIDSRTGISDVGGLSLQGFSDVNICIFANDRQNVEGMRIILPLLFIAAEQKTIIVQSLLRLNSSGPYASEILLREQEEFKANVKSVIGSINDRKQIDKEIDEEIYHVFKIGFTEALSSNINFSKIVELILDDSNYQNSKFHGIYREVVKPLITVSTVNFDSKMIILNKLKETKAGSEDTFNTMEDFKKRFVFKDEFSFIFRDEKFVILGNKGEGKSALFSLLKHSLVYNAYIKYLRNERILNFVGEWDVSSWIFIEGFSAPGSNNNFPTKKDFETVYHKCKNNPDWFENFWECLTLFTLEDYFKLEPKTFTGIEELINKFDNPQTVSCVYEKLKNINSQEEKKKVYLIYDYLDVHVSQIPEIRGKVISGLLSMWQKWYNINRNIKCKVFLRNDIYDQEVIVGNKTHLDDYKVNLMWDYNQLLKLVLKYLLSEFNEIREELSYVIEKEDEVLGVFITDRQEKIFEAIESIFGVSIHGGFASTITWIKNHLSDSNGNITPRTMLWVLSIGAMFEKANAKYINEKDVLIHGYSLKYALKGNSDLLAEDSISSKKVKELREEYGELYEYIEPLHLKLEGKRVPIEGYELLKAFDSISIEKEQALRERYQRILHPQDVVKRLEAIGVISEYKRNRDRIQYTIPDLYLYGLGLIRKGS